MHINTINVFRWGDIFVLLFLLTGCALSIPAMLHSEPQTVSVFRNNELIGTYPLNEDKEIVLYTYDRKPFHISIKNHSVAITESTCPHKLCVKNGAVSHPSQQIVCAPNHILITVSGNRTQKGTPDGIAR